MRKSVEAIPAAATKALATWDWPSESAGSPWKSPQRSTEPPWRTRHTYTYATTHGSTGVATPALRRTRAMEACNSVQLDFLSATALSAAAGWRDCSCALIQDRK